MLAMVLPPEAAPAPRLDANADVAGVQRV